ncbi:hypothetical protein JCM14244_05690 [Venenivibrio stagnispumantis]|uniref:NTF2 domain-containing protein n=1 Tax=Venenivibrio stagnispumantis TaxID=407998 RepID=A0AA45WI58_9AQUI|nr:hypothetical protein [Venenivibrio stagnispumantis]MCW4572743.1 hypothetical protein [Venenivibrio stagnispumantis]SMP00234.1 hypothetical protein SAMN06264868_10130 [Venenivibrio stagnispumantis]
MFSVAILNLYNDNQKLQKNLDIIQESMEIDNLDKIVIVGKKPEDINTELDVEYLEINSDNKAFLRNKALEKIDSEYTLWLSDFSELDDFTIDELVEVANEYKDADIIYPNSVYKNLQGDKSINMYPDFYGREKDILQTLSIENFLPEFGVLTKNQTVKDFNEDFDDFEFYEKIYKNLNNLKLKCSDISFITINEKDSFIDTSYRAKAIRDLLEIYDLKEIFKNINWEDENSALATAYTIIGDRLSNYYDFFNATEFYRKALLSFHNKHTLKQLIKAYVYMGLFDKAKELVSQEQGLNQDEIKAITQEISQAEQIINLLEKSVLENKLDDVLSMINEVIQYYKGAMIYNILGVIFYYKQDLINSYRFFHKAFTMNPIDEDILRNLVDLAKLTGNEEKVKKLVKRLIG